MKITKVEPILLSYEYKPDEQWGWSGGEVKVWHTSLVRVWTDEGIYGLGEMGTGHYIPEAAKSICEFLAGTLIGQDPFSINVLFDKMYKLGANWGRRGIAMGVISGIENALWDLKGKALGLPVWSLLGGKFRNSIRTYASGGMEQPIESLIKEVNGYIESGFTAVKIRGGYNAKRDIQKVKAIREALGYDFDLAIDCGQGYVIELGEFVKRRCDVDIENYRTLCYDLLGWFAKYENSDGLLEKLPGWNLIEWSQASDWIDDVNYPTNMLYSLTCRIAGELFDDKALRAKAESLKEKITKQSFDGELFVDNAIRDENGVLAPTGNHSEICQYFAYFCKIAEPNDDRYKSLIDTIVNVFGSEREEKGIMPEIVYAQPFIGYYVRMLILLDLHKFRNIIRDIKGYFLNMANTTGTLWEYGSIEKSKGSLNHGFASYAGVALLYAVSGISCIKYDEKKLCIDRSFMYEADYNLKISVPEGSIEIIKKDTVKTVNVPEGWEIV